MLNVKVRILKDGKWQDNPWDKQFSVTAGDEISVSPNLAHIMVESGHAKLTEGFKKDEKTEPTKEPKDYTFELLGIPEPIIKKLKENGINTVPELMEKTAADLLELNSIGQGKVDDINDALAKADLSLAKGGE